MIGKVTTWYMTEEERLAYIKKHPNVPIERPKGSAFADVQYVNAHRKRAASRKAK